MNFTLSVDLELTIEIRVNQEFVVGNSAMRFFDHEKGVFNGFFTPYQ